MQYDRGIRVAVPGYELLHDLVCALMRAELAADARLLIVGSGTGMEIVRLAGHGPGWTFTGVDPSTDMAAIAREKVGEAGLTGRVELRVGRASELPVTESWDAATLLLVMHFLPDDGEKLDLLRAVSARLRPGAPLALADLYGETRTPRFESLIAAWRVRLLAEGMDPDDVEEMLRQVRADLHLVGASRMEALLREAGFREVERFYGALLFGGWIARKEVG